MAKKSVSKKARESRQARIKKDLYATYQQNRGFFMFLLLTDLRNGPLWVRMLHSWRVIDTSRVINMRSMLFWKRTEEA